jgi:D-alanyl-D-alanine carboxypeptidase/D-alanyl-D-alanine-endopeptidase (penicillin-binding protein 4)
VARRDRRSEPRGRSLRGVAFRWVPVLLVLVLLGGAAAAYHYDLGVRWFGATPDAGPSSPPVPGLTLPAVAPPRLVARPAPSGRPAPSAVRRTLGPSLDDPDLADLRAVVAPLSGPPVLVDGRGASMPASTLKLLTATAALEVLGPGHTFATRVVADRRRSLTLVGGGDPYLVSKRPARALPGDASLQTLAAETARALKSRGVHAVSLAYDASLFTGPEVSPAWRASYVPDAEVSPITALWADRGVAPDGSREPDPAESAAEQFAAFLRADGIDLTGDVEERTAPPDARELARVTSLPLADIVERVLQVSDNDGAEVLGHQTGLAVNGHGSFAGGAAAVRQTLTDLGIGLPGAKIYDGSGLSRHDRLSAETLVSVLQLASASDHPELRSVVTGLPVAAYDGSLAYRFDRSSGRGWVRAKTGTLTGTSALAGLVTDARGRPLVFAFLSNHIPPAGTDDARDALDDLAATLATCPC